VLVTIAAIYGLAIDMFSGYFIDRSIPLAFIAAVPITSTRFTHHNFVFSAARERIAAAMFARISVSSLSAAIVQGSEHRSTIWAASSSVSRRTESAQRRIASCETRIIIAAGSMWQDGHIDSGSCSASSRATCVRNLPSGVFANSASVNARAFAADSDFSRWLSLVCKSNARSATLLFKARNALDLNFLLRHWINYSRHFRCLQSSPPPALPSRFRAQSTLADRDRYYRNRQP